MADPVPFTIIVEVSILGGLGSAAFLTVGPMISTNLGTYFVCQTAQYAIGASMAGGFSASGITIRCATVLTRKRHKDWLKANAGKYVINNVGKLERLPPLVFIAPGANGCVISPITILVLINSYYFVRSYLGKRKKLS